MFISFLNPQGNFDKYDSRWVTHPDFGGQLVYVKELAIAMANMGHKIDIVTRQIKDEAWPEFSAPVDSYKGVKNLRIVRIPCGKDKFLNKEELWPYLLPEFTENLIRLYEAEGHLPDAVTSHYSDGGLCAAYFKERTGVPFTFTAHSLGAQKMDKLKLNKYTIEEMDKKFNFSLRLLAERTCISKADKIITSTLQERFNQYTHTAYQEAVIADDDSKFAIIPPGVSIKVFNKEAKRNSAVTAMIEKVMRRDIDPERIELPAIISSSRLDKKKNISAIVRAFGESKSLQDEANLIIVTRGYKNPLKDYKRLSSGGEREVLIELISLIDRYDLRGKVSMISIEKQEDLAHMYRYFSKSRSVFCLSALYEPFGLAPLEAMACGLPVVVTKFGGPAETLREGDKEFGILVDPNDTAELAGALYSLTSSETMWDFYAEKGYNRVLEKYTWDKTALSYLDVINEIINKKNKECFFNVPIHKYFINPTKEPKPNSDILYDLYLKIDILCIGETVIDFISTKKTNSLIDADNFSRYPGGNPAYVAVYSSKIGKKTTLLTKLGRGHFSAYIENELRKYGVNTEYIKYTDQEDTSVAFLTQTPTTPDFQSMHSADRKLSIKDIDSELIERADIVYTSLSSMIEEPSRSAVQKALRIAKRAKKTIAFDPNYHPRKWRDKEEGLEILAQACFMADIVKPSLGDARHIFDYNMKEEELVNVCINSFHEWGAKIVVLTAEGRYVIISDKDNYIKVTDLPKINILDATGGGRAFMSGFLAAYHEGVSFEKCVRFGHEVASIALQFVGPFPKTIIKDEIYKKIENRDHAEDATGQKVS